MKKLILSLVFVAMASTASARDQITIVGSSTVFPFSTTVAEKFGQQSAFKTPVVESTGSGGGLKLFCAGIGMGTPDIANASRAIKQKELDTCAANGIKPVERLIGYDGIAFANSKNGIQMNVTKEEIFLAVAAMIPDGNGGWKENDNHNWSDINPALPDYRIDVMIPPTTSGTRDAFVELIMHSACKTAYGMSKKEYKANCSAVRTSIHVVQVGENDNLIIEKLVDDERRMGIFGFSFLDQNSDKVQGSIVNGVEPTFETIADGSYGVSRPLFYYIKDKHIGVVPGLMEYDAMFKKMAQPDGPLEEQGLITISE